jgi:hypothetical protein
MRSICAIVAAAALALIPTAAADQRPQSVAWALRLVQANLTEDTNVSRPIWSHCAGLAPHGRGFDYFICSGTSRWVTGKPEVYREFFFVTAGDSSPDGGFWPRYQTETATVSDRSWHVAAEHEGVRLIRFGAWRKGSGRVALFWVVMCIGNTRDADIYVRSGHVTVKRRRSLELDLKRTWTACGAYARATVTGRAQVHLQTKLVQTTTR